jgi:hypothetical protein
MSRRFTYSLSAGGNSGADGSAGAFFLAGIRGRGRFAGAAATGAFICTRGHVSQ